MKKILSLLIGEKQDIRLIIIMLIPSFFFALYIFASFTINLNVILTAIFAFDIFAGLLSNLQEKTHLAWEGISKSKHILFVVVHLTLYPLIVVLFNVSIPLMILMLAMLIAKTSAFVVGNKLI